MSLKCALCGFSIVRVFLSSRFSADLLMQLAWVPFEESRDGFEVVPLSILVIEISKIRYLRRSLVIIVAALEMGVSGCDKSGASAALDGACKVEVFCDVTIELGDELQTKRGKNLDMQDRRVPKRLCTLQIGFLH